MCLILVLRFEPPEPIPIVLLIVLPIAPYVAAHVFLQPQRFRASANLCTYVITLLLIDC